MRMTELGNLFSFINRGKAPSYVDASNVCVINQACIRWDKIDFSKAKYQDEDCINDAAILMDGDLLVASTGTGTLGRCNVFYAPDDRIYMADTHVTIVRGTKSYSPYVIMCYMMMDATQQQLYAQCVNGSTNQIELSRDKLRRFLVPELDAVEQEIFVQLASCLKRSIELRQRQLRTLDTLIKARFVEMFGDMADPDCEWPDCKLIEVCDENDDIKCGPCGTQLSKDEYQESGIPVWEIPQINSAFAIPPEHFVTAEKAEQLRAYSLSAGDIVMSRKGNVGKCAIFPADKPNGILHSDVLRIRVSNKKANPCFIMCQLHFSRDIIRQIEMVSSGAIMAGVNVTKLKEIIVKLPPLDIQCQFAFFVSQVDKSKVAVQAALDKARVMFDGLMQEYFG